MAITLRIDNFDRLPDGGPIEFTAGSRGFDIGRQQHLDWCLPDDSRVISGLHCQVRFEQGAYWLNDVSRNGTYVNGSEGRVQSPYRLQHGDRLRIGQYFITVAMSGMAERPADPPPQRQDDFMPASGGDIWATGNAAPQPVDRRWFAGEQRRGQRAPDVLEHFVDLPGSRPMPGPAGGNPYADPFGASPQPVAPQYPVSPQPGPPPFAQGTGIGGPPPFAQGLGTGIGAPPMPMPNGGYGGAPAEMPASAFLAAVASAAGMSPQALLGRSPEELANEFGAIIRIVTEQLSGLLRARAAAKQMAKSGDRTMISAQNNNPLKFVPDPREAMDVMFQRNRAGYLGAAASYKEGFDNIKAHELATYAAMQKALAKVMDDLSPDSIEESAGSSAFGTKKARAWDIYVERWNSKTEPYEHGILGLFLDYFGKAYDSSNKG